MSESHFIIDTIFTLAFFGAFYWHICVAIIIVMLFAVIKTQKMLFRILFILIALIFAYLPFMQYLW
ncbi:hypothetical protein I5F12_08380 [Proteus cibarius]|uniref:Uncharacterized protein n=1 Tax=Proteus terrae subsp. cibarius TaxID=626774 RepID=A0A6G6STB9_9GAMM|nr:MULTISPECIES: hypothetical protein [Proteus]NHW58496.1 hypothetical protein [Escherichia coli]QHP76368.1 hypothetical protein EKQ45_10530 [Proteus vulgaris]MBG2913024.1 hypothetical protein [Proteus terrae subsp. cibarius]MBG3091469.1 hypothetical protein [Proteus terrae subsp. cibarius]MBG6038086.1 hypothetical protein [Proteus terrae subsp. cibarius]